MGCGKLRVYLGAAPGVGKTHAMLDEGHRRVERGTDVVVGFVETHGRKHTADLLEGLKLVPRRQVTYRGATFAEMDLHAVLARWPAVALVDELAHTNVARGWQRETLAGHPSSPGRGHRRHLHGQPSASGVTQRRGREDHRGAAA